MTHLTKNRLRKLSDKLSDFFNAEVSQKIESKTKSCVDTFTLEGLRDAMQKYPDAVIQVKGEGIPELASLNVYWTHLHTELLDCAVIPVQTKEYVKVKPTINYLEYNVFDCEIKRGDKDIFAEKEDNVLIMLDNKLFNIDRITYRGGRYRIFIGNEVDV